MAYGVRISEATNIVGTIQTASGTGTYASDVWSLSSQYGRRFIAYVNIGVIGSSGTVAYTFQVSTTSTGTYTSVTGGAIESNTTGGQTPSVEVDIEQVYNSYPTAKFMRGYLTLGVAGTQTGVVILSTEMSNMPVGTYNAANALATVVTDA